MQDEDISIFECNRRASGMYPAAHKKEPGVSQQDCETT